MDKKDSMGMKSNIHAILYGPDGEIKDERTSESIRREKELKEKEVKENEKS